MPKGKPNKTKQKRGPAGEIAGIILIAIGVFLGICIFLSTDTGILGGAVKDISFGLFGRFCIFDSRCTYCDRDHDYCGTQQKSEQMQSRPCGIVVCFVVLTDPYVCIKRFKPWVRFFFICGGFIPDGNGTRGRIGRDRVPACISLQLADR